jgi:anti-sigma regulatory factor (Ser/Thr protein kinase)
VNVPAVNSELAYSGMKDASQKAKANGGVTVSETVPRPRTSFQLRVVMLSDPRFLSVVRAAVGQIGLVYGLTDDSCRGVTLAVDEAVANIIRHAYKNRYDQEIELNCRAGADQLEFTLIDRGEPADPARICAQPLDEVSLSGRGTHLIKATMDEMHYERVPRGNQLRLIKHLSAGNVMSMEADRSGA